MSQGTDGNEFPQTTNVNAQTENEVNPEQSVGNDKSKLNETEGVKVVKSKIREREASQLRGEEEDTVNNLRVSKVSGSKVSRFSRLKKVKSKTSDPAVSEELPVNEPKVHSSETAIKTDDAKVHEFVADTKSKQSLPSDESDLENKKFSYPSENQDRGLIISDLKKKSFLKESTFVMSHDVETQRDISRLSQTEMRKQIDRDPSSHDTMDNTKGETINYERGNYMNNLAPEPIEEFENPPEQEEGNKEKTNPRNG